MPRFATLPPRHEAQVKSTHPIDSNNSFKVPYFIHLCIKYLPCVLHKLASSSLRITSLVTRLRVVLSGSSPTFGRDLSRFQLVQSSISSRPRGAYRTFFRRVHSAVACASSGRRKLVISSFTHHCRTSYQSTPQRFSRRSVFFRSLEFLQRSVLTSTKFARSKVCGQISVVQRIRFSPTPYKLLWYSLLPRLPRKLRG